MRLLVFEMWSILFIGDFHVFDLSHQNRPCTKSTISQKLKVAQKKLLNKNQYQSNILSDIIFTAQSFTCGNRASKTL